MAFADAVRELALKIDPLVTMEGGRRLAAVIAEDGWAKAKQNPDVRRLLQNIGTGVRDVLGEQSWTEFGWRQVSRAFRQGTSVVITDVRFKNEADGLYQSGGYIVRITRPGVGPVNGHISETAIDDIEPDHVIVNDGTPEELQAKLVAYAESLAAVEAA